MRLGAEGNLAGLLLYVPFDRSLFLLLPLQLPLFFIADHLEGKFEWFFDVALLGMLTLILHALVVDVEAAILLLHFIIAVALDDANVERVVAAVVR